MMHYYLIKDLDGTVSLTGDRPFEFNGIWYDSGRYLIDNGTLRKMTATEYIKFRKMNPHASERLIHWNWAELDRLSLTMCFGTCIELELL